MQWGSTTSMSCWKEYSSFVILQLYVVAMLVVESSLCRFLDRMKIGNCILYCSILKGVFPVIFSRNVWSTLRRERRRMERGPKNPGILDMAVMPGRVGFLISSCIEGSSPIFLPVDPYHYHSGLHWREQVR